MLRSYKVRSAGSSKMPLWGDKQPVVKNGEETCSDTGVTILVTGPNTAPLELFIVNIFSCFEVDFSFY